MPLVSSVVQECQSQQMSNWKDVQKAIQEAKNNIGAVMRNVQTGNSKLSTVSEGIPSKSALLG